jgi:hypothetical protein
MKNKNPIPHRVLKWIFMQKMRGLSVRTQESIINYMNTYKGDIHKYEYGHVPGHRIYRIVLKNGNVKDWDLIRQ